MTATSGCSESCGDCLWTSYILTTTPPLCRAIQINGWCFFATTGKTFSYTGTGKVDHCWDAPGHEKNFIERQNFIHYHLPLILQSKGVSTPLHLVITNIGSSDKILPTMPDWPQDFLLNITCQEIQFDIQDHPCSDLPITLRPSWGSWGKV